jgi:uncharacterized protein with GYD domain
MLFVVDHEHSAETCPAGTIHPDKDLDKFDAQIKSSGVRVVEGYLDGPSHRFYFIVEADTTQQILGFAVNLIGIGEINVHPAMKWSDAIATSRKLGMQK